MKIRFYGASSSSHYHRNSLTPTQSKSTNLTWLWWFLDPYKSQSLKLLPPPHQHCHPFSLSHIKAATNNFSHIIHAGAGDGGEGTVYKGYIDEWDMAVVVKKLEERDYKEFNLKRDLDSEIRHRNLVSLIGYCRHKDQTIAVYEFTSRGNLEEHLYNLSDLPWLRRLKICIGAARGLDYLHSVWTDPIIHGDVKPSNILLDENWIPKISGLDLCEIGRRSCSLRGTLGYVDPEFVHTNELTEKSDVYSFGIMMLEVICGVKPYGNDYGYTRKDPFVQLFRWVQNCVERGEFREIIDPKLMGTISAACLKKFVEVGVSCACVKGEQRPTMAEVAAELENAMEMQRCDDIEMEALNLGDTYVYPDTLFRELQFTNYYYPEEFNMFNFSSPQRSGSISPETPISEGR